MPYFITRRRQVTLPVGLLPDQSQPSLWRGQRGAIFAIAHHFTVAQNRPGIVSMPTGSGKTAVLMLAPFLLDARRVLVVTPSRLVRGQIAREFSTLEQLRRARVLPDRVPLPTVAEVEHRLGTVADWRALSKADVVVATPNVASPAYDGVAAPPRGFFDLVLVDEAHHSAATTWKSLLEQFPEARRILFTATPFRSDNREIQGRFIYVYSLLQAFEDGVLDSFEFHPVIPQANQDSDLAIALEAERVLTEARIHHPGIILMVRANTKKKARALADLYQDKTSLKLAVIDSDRKVTKTNDTLALLDAGRLDGIICVDMMSEGFDFPRLKIAALHAPHKSLGVTLQFIGRFARRGDGSLGTARFLAVESEITIEAQELFKEGKVWSSIVPSLVDKRVEQERRTRDSLETFELREISDEEFRDLSLYALRPAYHVKVYRVIGEASLNAEIEFPKTYQVKFRQVSQDMSVVVFVTAHKMRPKWTYVDTFDTISYGLFVVYYSQATRLLFVCASEKSNYLYDQIMSKFCPDGASRLPHDVVKRAIAGLDRIQVQNLGLRSRTTSKNVPSYQTWTGPRPLHALTRSHSLHYHPGHLSGRAYDNGRLVTFGVSTSSKVWSSDSSQIPELIDWCEGIAVRIDSNQVVVTNSEFDHLPTAEPATTIPDGFIAADWDEVVYSDHPIASYPDQSGVIHERALSQLELVADPDSSTESRLGFVVVGDGVTWKGSFQLDPQPHVNFSGDGANVTVDLAGTAVALEEFFLTFPLRLYFADRSMLIGDNYYRAHQEVTWAPFNPEQIKSIPWDAEMVDIQVEFCTSDKQPKAGRFSIHHYMEVRLARAGYDVVFYAHTTGECSDFVTVRREMNVIRFEFYHCKKSGAETPGYREGDVSDLASQVVKCLSYMQDPERLYQHIVERLKLSVPQFIVGNLDLLKELCDEANYRRTAYQIVAVQPGVKQSNMDHAVSRILAAAYDYVLAADCEPLVVWGSS